MKTLKEIEEKIKETTGKIYLRMRVMDLREYNAKTHGKDRILEKSFGWLVGLGMAKGIYGLEKSVNFTKGAIAWQIEVELCNPKTPYEQGKKEALSWCIGGD